MWYGNVVGLAPEESACAKTILTHTAVQGDRPATIRRRIRLVCGEMLGESVHLRVSSDSRWQTARVTVQCSVDRRGGPHS